MEDGVRIAIRELSHPSVILSKIDAKDGKLSDSDKFQAVLSNLHKMHFNCFCEIFDSLPH